MSNNSCSIHIVEDEPFLLELYKARFEQEGYEVCVSLNGSTVMKEVEKNKPDLILLDIIMPEVDGYQVLKEIKKSPKYKDIPVLIFSNLAQEEEIEKGLKLGADDYFVKSNYTPPQIVEKVSKMIEKYRKKTGASKKTIAKKSTKKSSTKKKK
jgi:DNA-binding response OmpR family regulator